MAKTRPRFRRPRAVWLIAAFFLVSAVAAGPLPLSAFYGGVFVVLIGLLFGGAWLLSPWSEPARRLILPDLATFDQRIARGQRVADALGRIPIFGYVWRVCQRLTRSTVNRMVAEQRAMFEEEHRRLDG
jgi:hypothetical protein